MHKSTRLILRVAEKNGARIVYSKKHIKIYDGDTLLGVVSHGANKRERTPGGDNTKLLKKFLARGWKVDV